MTLTAKDIREEINALRKEVNKLKIDLDWRVGNVTSNFSATKQQIEEIQKEESGHYRGVVKAFNERISALEGQIEEIEKSIADQAIKALHTHPEILHYMSATTTRLAKAETCHTNLEQCLVDHNHQNGEELRKIKDRLDRLEEWRRCGEHTAFDHYAIQKRLQEIEKQFKDESHLCNESNRYYGDIEQRIEKKLDELRAQIGQVSMQTFHLHPDLRKEVAELKKQYQGIQDQIDDHCGRIKTLEKWKENADEGMNNGAKRREQLEERLVLHEDRTRALEDRLREWNNRQKI